jgi:dockerin type I repeat protein
VNDDGIDNAQDMVLIRNAIQKIGDPLMIGWVDVDGDGSIGMNDYLVARKKLGSHLP